MMQLNESLHLIVSFACNMICYTWFRIYFGGRRNEYSSWGPLFVPNGVAMSTWHHVLGSSRLQKLKTGSNSVDFFHFCYCFSGMEHRDLWYKYGYLKIKYSHQPNRSYVRKWRFTHGDSDLRWDLLHPSSWNFQRMPCSHLVDNSFSTTHSHVTSVWSHNVKAIDHIWVFRLINLKEYPGAIFYTLFVSASGDSDRKHSHAFLKP